LSFLSKHPWDWLIHAALCAAPIAFGLAHWSIVAFVAVLIEYEQKSQVWYHPLSWKEYFRFHAFGDLFADWIGILCGVFLRSLI
jgi:hypothetical protein